MKTFRTIPLTLGEANGLVTRFHRHHQALSYHKVSIGAELRSESRLVGAAILHRPCSPVMDDKVTLEVARLVTDGTPNTCSFLLGASARLAWALGYLRIQTYTMAEESGISLRAAGWRLEKLSPGTKWNRPNRPRNDTHIMGPRIRWAAFAPEVFSRSVHDGLPPAFILGQAAARAGAMIESNPFYSAEEPRYWNLWREGWEVAYWEY